MNPIKAQKTYEPITVELDGATHTMPKLTVRQMKQTMVIEKMESEADQMTAICGLFEDMVGVEPGTFDTCDFRELMEVFGGLQNALSAQMQDVEKN